MPNLPAALLKSAQELRLHRHFLQELSRAELRPHFASLPALARERHQDFIRSHQEACERLGHGAKSFPDAALVASVAAYLERQADPLPDHPTGRHLNTVNGVLGSRSGCWLLAI